MKDNMQKLRKNYENNRSIKFWAEDDRPREKMILKGKNSLSNTELIAILLGSGSRNESALELAKRILNKADENLNELSKFSVNELCSFKGIGMAKAINILAALEIGRRRRETEALEKPEIKNSRDTFEIIQSVLTDLNYEEFWIILLNRANKVLKKINVSEGGLSGTVADPKKIFKLALDHYASSVILCHNHPSGNITPSDADKKLTRKILRGAEYLEISILDHIIVGVENYFSFADEGII